MSRIMCWDALTNKYGQMLQLQVYPLQLGKNSLVQGPPRAGQMHPPSETPSLTGSCIWAGQSLIKVLRSQQERGAPV